MAKDYGNIVFYRTKNGKLRWFDPTKIPGGHPREKKVAKAVENKKAFRSDESRNLNELKKSQSTRNLRNAKDNVRTARNKYEDAQYETQSAFKWGTGRYGRTPQEEKAEMKKAGTAVNQAENAERRALNEARRADPETFGKNRRDQQNINRAKKKIEQNKAYEAKHPRSAIEAASWIKNDGKDLQEKMKAKGIEDVKHEGNYRFSGRDKDGNRVIINTEPNQNDRMMGDMIRVTSIQTEKPAAPKEVKRTEMTPEREIKAKAALKREKRFRQASENEDMLSANRNAVSASVRLQRKADDLSAREGDPEAIKGLRRLANRRDNEARRTLNELRRNSDPISYGENERDQLNIERARKKAEERQHVKDVRDALKGSPNANSDFNPDAFAKYYDVKDGKVELKPGMINEVMDKSRGRKLNARSAFVQNAAMGEFQNRAKAKTAAATEPEKKQQPIRYVIKDRHGNQLSSPNENDGELWDRVADRDPDGRRGLHVVAHVEEKSQEKAAESTETNKSGKKVALTVNPEWSEYDRTVGKQHLMNYGRIYLDEYGVPVDDEYVTEDRHRAYQRTRKRKKAWKD